MESLRTLARGRIVVGIGDITDFEGDAIVNAANSSLLGGGGVDGAIHRAGGAAILEECRALRASEWHEGLPAGKAVATCAGRLRVKAVIHTVGPVWRDGKRGEDRLLASCYRESLAIAAERGWSSIAFPAISTGAYGYPKDLAATVAYDAIAKFLDDHEKPETVNLVFFSRLDAELFLRCARIS
jgi:O-acetyl-ADP-ribose deacetylase (regulator of RNase III)